MNEKKEKVINENRQQTTSKDMLQGGELCCDSPVWMYVCFFMSDFWWNRLPQCEQG